jgi:hypothetical protein
MLTACDQMQALGEDFGKLPLELSAKGSDFVVAQGNHDLVDGRNGGEFAEGADEDGDSAEFLELLAG